MEADCLKVLTMSSADVFDDLDKIVAEHDLAYQKASSVRDYWKADAKMIWRIDQLQRPKTKTEKLVRLLMEHKRYKLSEHYPR